MDAEHALEAALANPGNAHAAHRAANEAIREGILVKEPCSICGATERVRMRHDDYLKPLEVRWLCPAHFGGRRYADPRKVGH